MLVGSGRLTTKGTRVPGFATLIHELRDRGPGCAVTKGGRLDEALGLVQPFTEWEFCVKPCIPP